MNTVKTTVPIKLKVKCNKAVLFAFLPVPRDASKAVTQVPIFDPKTMNNASPTPKALLPTKAIITPVAADEL